MQFPRWWFKEGFWIEKLNALLGGRYYVFTRKEYFSFRARGDYWRNKYDNLDQHRKHKAKYGNNWSSKRQMFLEKLTVRDGKICQQCLRELTSAECTIDHIIPVSKGGTHDLSNLQILCGKCNVAKGDSLKENQKLDKSKWRSNPMRDAFERAGLLQE